MKAEHLHPDAKNGWSTPANSSVPDVDAELLAPIVAQSLGRPAVKLGSWTTSSVHGGMGETLGVFRLVGELADGVEWSLILKAIGKPAAGGEAGDWNDWRREAHLYRSDVADDLPAGLVRVECYGVTLRGDDLLWVWLEDVPDPHTPWRLDEFADLAELLGRFHARYLLGEPVPDHPWLSRGWLRRRLATSAPVMDVFPAVVAGNPWLQKLFPPDTVATMMTVWDERERYLAVLDGLPRTFAHRDVWPRNALRRPGGGEFVLIDWAFAGDAAIGEELCGLVSSSIALLEATGEVAHQLERTVLERYTAGLDAAGWHGDPRLAELGYRAATMLHAPYASIDVIVGAWGNEQIHPMLEALLGVPIDFHIAGIRDFTQWYLDPNIAATRALASELGR